MPIETWTRSLPCNAEWSYFNSSSGQVTPLTGSETYHLGSQTTTSMRTKPQQSNGYGHRGFKKSSPGAAFVRGQAQREADYNQMTGPQILGHLGEDNREINGDVGNEFYTKKVEYTMNMPKAHVTYRPAGYSYDFVTYDGPITNGIEYGFADSSLPSHDKIITDGTACVRQTIPTTQQAVLAQFLLELREDMPHLYGSSLLKGGVNGRAVGDEYLNQEFGIAPLVSDVKKIGRSILHFNKLVKDFQKKSGANVHRRHTLYRVSEQPYESQRGTGRPYLSRPNNTELYPQLFSFGGYVDISYLKTTTCSFSGAYTYYLDQGHNYLERLAYWGELADYLLGTSINPSTVWELTPWSWLADWFSNTGTFISNVNALHQDALVMKYGYVMHTCVAVTNITSSGMQRPSYMADSAWPRTFSDSITVTEKRRTRATPYGFGVDLGSLTPQRWAILSALGLTRGEGSVHYRS